MNIRAVMDAVEGHKVLIASTRNCKRILDFRSLVEEEIRDDWLIGFQLDYNYQVKIINNKHPEHKRIIKLINWSLEHGVVDKRERLFQSGMLLMYYLVQKFASQEIIDAMNRLISKRRIEITINELESLLLLLIIGLSFSILTFIIEIIFFFINNNLINSKGYIYHLATSKYPERNKAK